MLPAAFLQPWSPRPTRPIGSGSGVTRSQKGAFWSSYGDFVRPRVYSASAKGIAYTEKTAGEKTFDTLRIVLTQPKAVGNLLPICIHFFGIRYHFVPFFRYMFICIVSRSKTHGVLLRLFKCRVRKIINCCPGKCGRWRPQAAWPSSAQPPARTPTWAKSAPRTTNGPRFATPGAGQIVKEH